MPAYRLTIRHGSRVKRESHATLDEALAAMDAHVVEIRREGPLEDVSALREYAPEQRVHARLELSTRGFFRGREAGIDVMGNGALVPYLGVVRKRKLEAPDGGSAFDAVRRALSS